MHEATLQLGLPWVPAGCHTAGACCSSPLCPRAMAGTVQAARFPARVLDLAIRDPGSMMSPGGREQHGGGVLDLLSPHPQRWRQQAVRSILAALGEGNTQAVMPEQPPTLAACFQRNMGCTAAMRGSRPPERGPDTCPASDLEHFSVSALCRSLGTAQAHARILCFPPCVPLSAASLRALSEAA